MNYINASQFMNSPGTSTHKDKILYENRYSGTLKGF